MKENFVFLIFIIFLFYFIIMPWLNYYNNHENNVSLENFKSLLNKKGIINKNDFFPVNYNNNNNNNLSNNLKVDKQFCSINCCGLNQWTPLMDPNYNSVTKELNYDYGQWALNIPKNFVGSNFSCNNGNNGSGCVCLSNQIVNNLASHGGNLYTI